MSERHMYVFDSKVVDAGVVRANAMTISRGDSRHGPVPVTIHFHSRSYTCVGQEHEHYKDGKKVTE